MNTAINPGPLVEPGEELSRDELARYARHLSLPGIGLEGQRRLRAASVLVIGAGGLGAPVLQYLAAAGVGALTVIDDDVVETSNLQRQILHRDADVSRAKVDSARDALLRLDPNARVRAITDRLSPDNALELFASHDLVIDGADNFATRYLSNDAAELTGTPLVWGTIFRYSGQVSTFVPDHGPMLRDLFPDIPEADSVPNCAEGGVFGVLCGTVGSAMATEAIKLICGIGAPYIGRLLRYDALSGESSTLRFSPDPDRPPVTDLAEVTVACAARDRTADDGADLGRSVSSTEIGVVEFLAGEGERLLIDVREDWERELSSIPGSVHVPLGAVRSRGWDAVAPLVDTGAEREVVGTDTVREIIVHCKSGVRSAEAVDILTAGAPARVRIRSLSGGIDAWSASNGTGAPQGR
ncbi:MULTISPECIES: molybdopterin-synthase adenylyltransferase MoeB [unclassified Brevibacterium]|uniref:molybdopterin-synthase adenylyltransferase MoeB n=1 Tax=unclassified Brevibacterium TaxID=2614124 RepID=UPI001E36578C|nr:MULTISPECIES: molybdopterin-synthase adenylyltransferase MoeB [unclassified Brevibacterium]MCD1284522.1 adenylyltransferase/sulfurtransferase MoeZ [Brevibacterium sp. CCUG 69071]MDK8435860.1 molybdopterin-synthase adenylyltransferase MoeB [Brevibacterium sp. H-BE7]